MAHSTDGHDPRRRAPAQAPAAATPLPVVKYLHVDVGDDERGEIRRLARRLRSEDRGLGAGDAFGANLLTGMGGGPNVVIEDHSWITLFELRGNKAYSYRALLLAGEGDQVVIGTRRSPEFEQYCRKTLRLGRVEVLEPARARRSDSLALRATRDRRVLDRVVARARAAQALNVVPYMGTGGVWRFAATVAAHAGMRVHVAAPPPALTRRANDKLWFTRRVREVLGSGAHPETRAAYGSAMLAHYIATFVRRHEHVAVKLTASASGEGNFVLRSADLQRLSREQLRRLLHRRLQASGWRGAYPVLVSAWEGPVAISPSVQMWIPDPEAGPPIVEGIFEQQLTGLIERFAGATPTGLSPEWQRRLAAEAVRLGCLLQELGYFGRCSFDAIIVGRDTADAALHWIECNGRWGGVSLPLTLANRLVGDWRTQPFVVIERHGLQRSACTLGAELQRLRPLLYVAGATTGGAVILSPLPIESGEGFEVMVMAESVAAAGARSRRVAAAFGVTDHA